MKRLILLLYPGQAWRNGISLRVRDSDVRLAGVDIHPRARFSCIRTIRRRR